MNTMKSPSVILSINSLVYIHNNIDLFTSNETTINEAEEMCKAIRIEILKLKSSMQ